MISKINWQKLTAIAAAIVTVIGLIWRMETNHTDTQVKAALLEYRVQQLETQIQILQHTNKK